MIHYHPALEKRHKGSGKWLKITKPVKCGPVIQTQVVLHLAGSYFAKTDHCEIWLKIKPIPSKLRSRKSV
jgi:hypothetical protein